MTDKTNNAHDSKSKADDFDKEKEEARKNIKQNKTTGENDKSKEQQILKKQKETD